MPAVMERTHQTTLRLPDPLYREAKIMLDQHQIEADSLNDLMVLALERFVRLSREMMIDAEFEHMATDKRYHALSETLAGEFARADFESLSPEGETKRAAR